MKVKFKTLKGHVEKPQSGRKMIAVGVNPR